MRVFEALGVILFVSITGFAVEPVKSAQHTSADSEDCRHAMIVQRLARIYGSSELTMITKETNAVCAAVKPQSTVQWSTKSLMKGGRTLWSYPNKNVAISGARFTYPNKEEAKSIAGALSYPDGQQARSSTRGAKWTRPDRPIGTLTLAELQEWACPRVTECSSLRAEIGDGGTEEQLLAVLELAWRAR